MIKVTVKLPYALYVCDGFCVVDVLPSPKSHCQPVELPERSWKFTVNGGSHFAIMGALKSAIGCGLTVIVCEIESIHWAYVLYIHTVNVPAVEYAWVAFNPVAVPPSPKDQVVFVGAGVELFRNVIGSLTQ